MSNQKNNSPWRWFLNRQPIRKLRYARTYGAHYRNISGFKLIDGWLADSEANKLFDIAASLPGPSPLVVELGSWIGKSSVILSQALPPGGRLVCVDPFNAAGEADSVDEYKSKQGSYQKTLLQTFQSNLAAHGRPSVVEFQQAYSFDAVKNWNREIDFIFIDASHDYDDVLQDLRQWSPFIKVGGWIAFHDVRLMKPGLDLSGPGQVVKDHVATNPAWGERSLSGSLYAARKVRNLPA